MTISLSEITDALRWLWLALGAIWIGYAWLHRVEYTRIVLGLFGLFALDVVLHWIAEFFERPDSNLPSDFSVYAVVMLVAASVGLSVAGAYARWRGLSVWAVVYAALCCAVAGAVAGRAQYVLFNWDFFVENQELMMELAIGGMSWRGAQLAGLGALFLYARLSHNSFWQLADAAALGIALASSIAWQGAHATHLYYGAVIDQTFPPAQWFEPLAVSVRAFAFNFVQDAPDAYNAIALRIPIQRMASIFYLLLFFVLLMIALREKARAHDGSAFVAYLVIAAAAGFLFGFWRGDATLLWNGLRADQWLDVLLLAFALALIPLRRRSTRTARPLPNASKVMQTA